MILTNIDCALRLSISSCFTCSNHGNKPENLKEDAMISLALKYEEKK